MSASRVSKGCATSPRRNDAIHKIHAAVRIFFQDIRRTRDVRRPSLLYSQFTACHRAKKLDEDSRVQLSLHQITQLRQHDIRQDRLWFFFQRQIRDGVQSVIPIQYGEKQACIQQSRHAERPQPLSRWTPLPQDFFCPSGGLAVAAAKRFSS